MPLLSFDYLELRYGGAVAQFLLHEIERAASLRPQYEVADPESRLARAQRIQDDMRIAA